MKQHNNSALDGCIANLKKVTDPAQKRIHAFTLIRDIPYGNIGSRNPLDVLKANKGTCSGKHALLKLVLEVLGYEVQSWFALHSFGDFPIKQWPEALQQFKGKQIKDYHDFLKVQIDNRWVTIDAMFDAALSSLGFPIAQWDGVSDIPLPIQTEETFQVEGDVQEQKKALTTVLSPENQQDRKAFLSALTTWIDSQRSPEGVSLAGPTPSVNP